MNKRQTLNAALVALLCLSASTFLLTSHAGIPVIDAANLSQNTQTAMQTYVSYVKQLLQYKQQIDIQINTMKALSNQVSNLKGLANLRAQAARVELMLGTSKRMIGVLENGATVVGNMNALYGAGTYKNWDQFATSLAQRKAAGDAVATNLIQSAQQATNQITDTAAQHEALISSIQGVGSPTEAGQATAAAVGIVVQQMQSMMGSLAAQNAAAARTEAKRNTIEVAGPQQFNDGIAQRQLMLDKLSSIQLPAPLPAGK